ncbi:hypothetical protein TruAng_002386 [Truncatella angustata]|nr:hypothetical protein TruAng_002386 [Truncatella angustata]
MDEAEAPDAQQQDEEPEEPENQPEATTMAGWTLNSKPVPFPFNMTTTALCAILQCLLVLGNLEFEHRLLFRYQIWRYLFHVVPRVLLSIALAFLSTLLYERILAYEEGYFRLLWNAAIVEPQRLMIRLIAKMWDVDIEIPAREEANRLRELHEMWRMLQLGKDGRSSPTAASIYETLAEAWETLVNVGVVVELEVARRLSRDGLLWVLKWSQMSGWQEVTSFINEDKIWVETAADPEDLWAPLHRIVGQVFLQLLVATVLLQVMFFYRFRLQEAQGIYEDDDMYEELRPKATFLRATAMHLFTYTAYQIIQFAIPDHVRTAVPGHVLKLETVQWLRTRTFKNFCLAPGSFSRLDMRGGACLEDLGWVVATPILTLAVHLAVRYVMRWFVRIGWWMADSIFEWQTLYIHFAVEQIKLIFLEQMDADLGLDDQVKSRALVSFFFPGSGPMAMMVPGGYDAERVWGADENENNGGNEGVD